jgi:hypothetical protein
MALRGRVLSAGLFATLALGAAAPSAGAVDIVSVGQAIGAGSTQTQTGRLAEDGQPSDCSGSVLKLAPSIQSGTEATQFGYINHTFKSSVTNTVCLTAELTTMCAGANSIFSVAYIGAFDPGDPLARYAADAGDAAPGSYSFQVTGGSFVAVVVHERNAGQGCSGYTLKLSSDKPWAHTPPNISGNPPAVGNTISGSNAAWATPPAPTTIERQWLRCDAAGANCAVIPGETGFQYTVTNADIGSTLRIRNVATDGGGTSTSDSAFVEPYIPFQVHDGQSLGPGDRVHSGLFVRNGVESRCQSPTSVPAATNGFDNFLYDAFPLQSLLNEPVCLIVRAQPLCGVGVTPSIYDPVFVPAAGIGENYAANSGGNANQPGTVSQTLPPGGAREVVASAGNSAGPCQSYTLAIGADAPFATARPTVNGDAAEGGTLTAGDGTWSGTPAISRSWRRCDAAGGNCTPIDGASGATYSPTAADVGARLRVRVTATQGRTVSSDSEPSGVVAAGPAQGGGGGGGGGTTNPPALDRTAPKGTLRLGSSDLARAVKTGRVPVSVTCDEACSATVELRVTRKLAKALGLGRRVVMARAKGNLRAGRRTTLRPKLASRARKALRRRRSVSFRLTATFADPSGNRAKQARRASLKRRR